jgi:lysyl-tRNA synthetase class 2
MSEADIRLERIKKVEALRAAGMEVYPVRAEWTHSTQEFVSHYGQFEADGQTVSLTGRVMSRRGQGGIIFADLAEDGTKIQLVLQQDDMDASSFALFSETVDAGDFIEATGVAYTTQRGAQSLKLSGWRMLAKSLLPLRGTSSIFSGRGRISAVDSPMRYRKSHADLQMRSSSVSSLSQETMSP